MNDKRKNSAPISKRHSFWSFSKHSRFSFFPVSLWAIRAKLVFGSHLIEPVREPVVLLTGFCCSRTRLGGGWLLNIMTYGIIFEKINEPGFDGYYYAHIPSLGLTTHGVGIDGARAMAEDMVTLWLEELISEGKEIPHNGDVLLSTLEIHEDALQTA
jgi:predicted RNase H-like HicB family nuclease